MLFGLTPEISAVMKEQLLSVSASALRSCMLFKSNEIAAHPVLCGVGKIDHIQHPGADMLMYRSIDSLNKYNLTVNIKALRTLPFPAIILLLV